MKKSKGPDMVQWGKFRHGELEQIDENYLLGVKTLKPMNRNSPELQENARKAVSQIESNLNKILEYLKIVNKDLNEGIVPDSKLGSGIMELAANIGAAAGKMWK